MKKSFLFVPGVGRVVLQELRFSQWSSRCNSVLNCVLHGSSEWSSRGNSVLNSVLQGSSEWSSRGNAVLNSVLHGSRECGPAEAILY